LLLGDFGLGELGLGDLGLGDLGLGDLGRFRPFSSLPALRAPRQRGRVISDVPASRREQIAAPPIGTSKSAITT
jgi:hypothetical protein